jgi:hypothetical protein
VQVQFVAIATVERGNYKWLVISLKSDVRQKSGVEDCVNDLQLVRSTLWQSANLAPL